MALAPAKYTNYTGKTGGSKYVPKTSVPGTPSKPNVTTAPKVTTAPTTPTGPTKYMSSGNSWDQHIGTANNGFVNEAAYAQAIQDKLSKGETLSDPTSAASFQSAHPELFTSGGTTSGTTSGQGYQQPSGYQQPTGYQQSQGNNSDALARLQKIFDQYAQNSTTRQQTLQDLLTASPTYKAPTADEMLAQSRQYAGLQVDPVLSAIQSRLSGARTSATNARTATEAAYAGVPAQTQARLEEARRYALENAISRGMGRSGVVEWNNAKLSAPIIQAETESEREKAAKLSAIANELANTESETGRLTQETEARRGALESARLTELQQLAQQLAAQDQQTRFNQGQAWANYGSQSDLAQASIRMLMEDLLRKG